MCGSSPSSGFTLPIRSCCTHSVPCVQQGKLTVTAGTVDRSYASSCIYTDDGDHSQVAGSHCSTEGSAFDNSVQGALPDGLSISRHHGCYGSSHLVLKQRKMLASHTAEPQRSSSLLAIWRQDAPSECASADASSLPYCCAAACPCHSLHNSMVTHFAQSQR